jgi:hypothetical protein
MTRGRSGDDETEDTPAERRSLSEADSDPPKDPDQRDLFQACYDLLKHICQRNSEAQKKLFPHIEMFAEHVGVEKLNVADTLSEIVRDNTQLIGLVRESLYRHFIVAILTWGRKARWLRFFEVFLEIAGQPCRRNQDIILRLVLEDWETLVDLECDYRNSPYLPRTDLRHGKTMLELIREGEHRMVVRSLVKYHYASLNLLALCCAGKNASNKARVLQMISVNETIDRFIWVGREEDGSRAQDIDADGVHLVRMGWVKLMMHAYLASLDTLSISRWNDAERVWQDAADPMELSARTAGAPGLRGSFLLDEMLVDMCSLLQRLQRLDDAPNGGNCREYHDDVGWDLQIHMEYVFVLVQALACLFGRVELLPEELGEAQLLLAQKLRSAASGVFKELRRLGLSQHAKAMFFLQLLSSMDSRGITDGSKANETTHFTHGAISQGLDKMTAMSPISLGTAASLLADEFDDDPRTFPANSHEGRFQEGWKHFKLYLAGQLGVDMAEGRSMTAAIADMAIMLGSRKTYRNSEFQVLGDFMRLLCDEQSDDPLLRLNGLRVVRAILYLSPDSGLNKNEMLQVSLP